MNNYILIPLCLLTVTLALPARSSVWKVSDGETSLYLGGTCHILRKSDFPLPAEFDHAYGKADALVFEVDPQKMEDPAIGMMLMQACMYTDGRSLKTVLSEEAYRALAEQGKKSNLPIEVLNGIKPGLAVMMISLQELVKIGVHQEGVDMHFAKKARADKKAVQGLETAAYQIDMIAGMGEGYESDFVLYGIKDIVHIKEYFDQLIAAWRSGDLAKLEELFLDDMKQFPKLYEDLMVKRNKAWIPQIEKMLKSPETEFVLVGVGHAVGEDGLLALLKKKGFQVEQLVVE